MFPHAAVDGESNSNRGENELANSTYQDYPQLYAQQFPYAILDESFLRHLLNFTSAKSETMHSIFANNATSPKHTLTDNDTLNYDTCSVTHDNESAWFSFEFQAIVHFSYITILLIAIFGNGIVCFIVCTSSRMQTVTNYFIANLALSDMLMAAFCIPFSFISLFVLQ
jgi:7 transmembrane receptor (rhodopsin family)